MKSVGRPRKEKPVGPHLPNDCHLTICGHARKARDHIHQLLADTHTIRHDGSDVRLDDHAATRQADDSVPLN